MKNWWRNISVVAGVSLCLVGCNAQSTKETLAKPSDKVTSFLQVNSEQGPISGRSTGGLLYFRGIPYAQPPVGELRWRAPQPALERNEILNAAGGFANRCYQRPQNQSWQKPEAYTQAESEDCLYMNIYRPDTDETDLPVMVWIHGGGLVNGAGSRPVNYGGNLARKNIVFVSFNYRLGTFGFFAHPELSSENPDQGRLFNYGLMDQIAALQWVQKNIRQFGGNPDNVTIFGESAGGYAVDMLVASQAKAGLFHKAISQSGYDRVVHPRVQALAADHHQVVEHKGTALAAALGQPNATLAALRQVPAAEIVKATNFDNFIAFAVDGVVVTEDVRSSFRDGKHARIPMLLGSTDLEFSMFAPEQQHKIMSDALPAEAMAELIPYYGSAQLRDTLLYSDYLFHAQARQLALYNNQAGLTNYVYRFGMPVTAMQNIEMKDGLIYGAPHAGELPYMFGNFTGDHMESTTPSEQERAVSDTMQTYWTNFAKYGNPNGPDDNAAALPHWPAYNAESNMIMRFTPEGTKAHADTWVERLDKVNSYLRY